jgi:oxygen-independent coproporphyrinogen-3 oxidase
MGPGLYVHVPFCVRKCAYCAFFSRPAEPAAVQSWQAGIERELKALPAEFAPETIFIGGGTPTALEPDDLARLLDGIHHHTDVRNVVEWTCEVNPGTLTPEKAVLLRSAGVNRLSIGAQSFNDATLRRLGRMHSAADTRSSAALAREAGFDHIALDLIYGVPGVPGESFRGDLESALALAPEHVSCYCLEIEEGTPLARAAAAGDLAIDEDEQRRQFEQAHRRLTDAGLPPYELSNFARPGCECRHNQLYWSGGDYIGIGPAAHSHWNGVRWGNTSELPAWKRAFEEKLEPAAKARETLVMGLRRTAGWGREEFRAATRYDYDDLRGPDIVRLAAEGRLVVEPDRIRLADEALFVSDGVFAELV